MNSSGYAFPAQGVFTGWEHRNVNDGGIYRYIGGDPNLSSSWLLVGGELTANPDTATWGTAQQGAQWFNKTLGQWVGWDGTQIILIG